jgi:hypothetical protein
LVSATSICRLSSRRGPGPQSCEQPGVAQPPSLMDRSPSHVVMQATWPPWPQPWHQLHSAEPLGLGGKQSSSDVGTGSVAADWSERRDTVSASGSGLVWPREEGVSRCAATHSGGGSRLMHIEQGACGVLQRWQRVLSRRGFSKGRWHV